MNTAKDIVLRPIDARTADATVERFHYSGKTVNNSQLHIGVFLAGHLEGAMQFGPGIDKRKSLGLVPGTPWNGYLELNRMAFSDKLPRNSESRALAVAMRLLRQHAPHVQWVISFADGTQSGDGAIYRASGFHLTGIRRNRQMLEWNGRIIASKTLDNANYPKIDGKYYSRVLRERGEVTELPGFQLRYIYFLDPTARARLTVPILPFSEIERVGAGMYRGEKVSRPASIAADAPGDQPGEDGSTPIAGLP